jgi:predicted transcriptional regulator
MGQDQGVEVALSIGRDSAVLTSQRANWAEMVSEIVTVSALRKGADRPIFQRVRADIVHHLLHRIIVRNSTHFLDARETTRRLRRLADRLIDRELNRFQGTPTGSNPGSLQKQTRTRYPKGPIPPGILLKTWGQLTFEEQRVLKLERLDFTVEETALILNITPNSVSYYLSQANRKCHEIYNRLCQGG